MQMNEGGQNGHEGDGHQPQKSASGGSSGSGAAAAVASTSTATATPQRSRTACVNCRTTKQKCDGPTRIPCRRCELYNLECLYSEASGRGAKRKAAEEAAGSDVPIPKPATVTSEVAQLILERLEELAQRTRTIEDTLRIVVPNARQLTLGGGSIGGGGSSNGGSVTGGGGNGIGNNNNNIGGGGSSSEPYTSLLPDTIANASVSRSGNPVSAIAETFQGIDDQYHQSIQEFNDFSGYPASPLSPDAVSRGLITVEQAQVYFAFFVDRCRYWVHGFLPQQFQDPMALRARSPLLFGAVCCTASFFLDAPNGEAGLQLYLSLVSLVNETLAPIIMSPRSSELDDEFILGIAICIIWKSPRIERTNMNVSNFQRMQTLAKLNNSTTYFLAGINSRAARVSKLNTTPHLFMKGDKSPKTVARVRLWLWMCFVDAHGCMQNGRAPSIDITDALKVTRGFAAIGDHPTDIELCALLETASVYRTFHGQSEDDKTSLQALVRANAEMDATTNYWFSKHPRLNYEGAFVTQFIAPFNRLVINADVYRSWSARNQTALENNSPTQPPPVLNHEEAKYLAKAIEAAQTILLNLSLAARAENGRRVGHFEEPQYWKDGMPIYRPLEPDADHARHIRTAVDTVICVIIVFSAMFLAKLRAANLMRCNLEVVTASNPIRSWDLEGQGQVALYSKFFRIIELASDFLEMVAPNPGHPSLTQSRVLRSLLATGTNRIVKAENNVGQMHGGQDLSQQQMPLPSGSNQGMMLPPHQQHGNVTLPKYPHTLIGQQTIDHSPNSPVAPSTEYLHQPSQQGPLMGQMDPSLNDMLNGIGQPGNPLVPSFLGGDEWSMLMSSLGLKPS